jgi:methylated-DNA-[protein]-cysteine S-methyltransferase
METATIPTPPGPYTLVVEDDAIVAGGWAPDAETLLTTIGPSRLPAVAAAIERGELIRHDELGRFTQAVRDYVDGDVSALDDVPVAQHGGPFVTRAWSEMRAIPAGSTRTYAELAARSGSPTAVRAAGSACARNTVALFVPCHRVLRTGGALGGFLYGLDVKRWLLDHEAGAAASAAVAV